MNGETNGAQSGKSVGHHPKTSKEVRDELAVMVRRGDFPAGSATVLVVDYFRHHWFRYESVIPEGLNLLLVPDTSTAEQAWAENPEISVVIVQGLSKRRCNPALEEQMQRGSLSAAALWLKDQALAGAPWKDWTDDFQHTLDFFAFLEREEFDGLAVTVSTMFEDWHYRRLGQFQHLPVVVMDKRRFFRREFTPKAVQKHSAQDWFWDEWQRREVSWPLYNKYHVQACEHDLTALEELRAKIATGDPWSIYAHAAQLVHEQSTCFCLQDARDLPELRWLAASHFQRRQFNRALWELLDESGLMGWMQLMLAFDLAGESREFEGFGLHACKELGRKLRGFFTTKGPSEDFI